MKRYFSIIPLLLGVIINLIFYIKGFDSFGFFIVVGVLLAVGLLSFEVLNRLHLLSTGDKTAKVIFCTLIVFSILFNLSGFVSSMLTNDQENENLTEQTGDQKSDRQEIKDHIAKLEADKKDIGKNLTFYSYKTGKYEPVTPIVEKSWEKAGTIEPGEIAKYRQDFKDIQVKIDLLYDSLKTSSREYVVQKKNIFDLLDGEVKKWVRTGFFFFLSILIALMPSMNLKYFYNLIKAAPEKITDMEISIISFMLWSSVTKAGNINSIQNVKAGYKNNLLKPLGCQELIESALLRLNDVIIYKDERTGHYKPKDGITQQIFYEKLREEIKNGT